MCKRVCATSLAALAAGLCGVANAAEPVRLEVGGFMNNWIGYARQDSAFETATTTRYNRGVTRMDAEVHFVGSTELDNGLEVGAAAFLEANRHATDRTAEEAFMYVEGATAGRLELGQVEGFGKKLHNQAPSVGFGLEDAGDFVLRPEDFRDYEARTAFDVGKGGKIQYVSPAFSGVQLYAGYAPTAHRYGGSDEERNGIQNETIGHDAWEAGLAYGAEYGELAVGADVGYGQYEGGRNFDGTTATLGGSSWHAGLSMEFAGFTVGASYLRMSDRDKGTATGADIGDDTFSQRGYAWDVGAAYATGPFAVSAAYIASRVDNTWGTGRDAADGRDRARAWELAGAYEMGPGITWGVSYLNLDFKRADRGRTGVGGEARNKGWALITGLVAEF